MAGFHHGHDKRLNQQQYLADACRQWRLYDASKAWFKDEQGGVAVGR